jgi:hypothetical protein
MNRAPPNLYCQLVEPILSRARLIRHHRIVPWPLSVMRTPVALPPPLKRSRTMQQRRRSRQTSSLDQRLAQRISELAQTSGRNASRHPAGRPVEEGPPGRNSLPRPRVGIVARPENAEVNHVNQAHICRHAEKAVEDHCAYSGTGRNARLEYFIVREADRISAIATLLSGGGQSHAISCSDCICESLQTAVSS